MRVLNYMDCGGLRSTTNIRAVCTVTNTESLKMTIAWIRLLDTDWFFDDEHTDPRERLWRRLKLCDHDMNEHERQRQLSMPRFDSDFFARTSIPF